MGSGILFMDLADRRDRPLPYPDLAFLRGTTGAYDIPRRLGSAALVKIIQEQAEAMRSRKGVEAMNRRDLFRGAIGILGTAALAPIAAALPESRRFATGGVVSVNEVMLVGERGGESIIPAADMRRFEEQLRSIRYSDPWMPAHHYQIGDRITGEMVPASAVLMRGRRPKQLRRAARARRR